MQEPRTKIPILTIAGSDCSGGAGVQADIKTFSAHNLFAMSVIICVVAENTKRVISAYDIPSSVVDEQFLSVFEDIVPKAVKIGMLPSKELMACVAKNLSLYKPENIVLDPVMFAKNGFALMDIKNCEFFKETMLKFADILTPNIPEAQYLSGFEIKDEKDMIRAAKDLVKLGAKAVLLKGGHKKDNANDVLYDGKDVFILESDRIDTKNTHGTGCTLSSAIASNLAKGKKLYEAVKEAKDYVYNAILNSLDLGQGHGPTDHFYFLKD